MKAKGKSRLAASVLAALLAVGSMGGWTAALAEEDPSTTTPVQTQQPQQTPDVSPAATPSPTTSATRSPSAPPVQSASAPPAADNAIAPRAAGTSTITATIKNADGSDTEQDLRSLMEAGTSLSWHYNKQKMLTVKVDSTLNLPGKHVHITVPAGVRLVQYPESSAQEPLIQDLTITRPAGDWGGHEVQGGTLDYTLRDTAESVSFNIMLEIDKTIWNKTDGQSLADAIVVRALADGDGGSEQKDEVKVDATVSGVVKQIFWNNDQNKSVPAMAHFPFKVRQWLLSSAQDGTQFGQYYKTLKLVFPLPHDPAKDDYAAYTSYLMKEDTSIPAPTVSVDDAAHTVTFTWQNMLEDEGGLTLTPLFAWTTERNDSGQIDVDAPKAEIVYADGSTKTLPPESGHIPQLDIVQGEQLSLTAGSKTQYNWYDDSPDVAYQFGQFWLRNDGFVLNSKRLTFTYSSEVGVIAQRIPVDRGATVTNIQYRTNLDSTLRVYQSGSLSSTTYSGSGVANKKWSVVVTAAGAGLADGEYFTYLCADVPAYSTGYIGYNPSAGAAPDNGGVTFGKFLEGGAHSYADVATMTMEDIDEDGNLLGTGQTSATTGVTSTLDDSFTVQMHVGSANLNAVGSITAPILPSTATAGETVNVNGRIELTNYPYKNAQMTIHPVLYLRLPKDIAVEDLQLYKVQTVDTGAAAKTERLLTADSDYTVTKREEPSGDYNVYQIRFSGTQGRIGWFNDELGQRAIRLSFDMAIGLGAKAQGLDLRDCLFVADEDHAIEAQGSLASFQVPDQFDVDNDGDTAELMSTTASAKLAISAARRGLLFKSGVKLSGESGYYDYDSANPDKKTAYLTGDQTLDFRFIAQNSTGRDLDQEETSSFYYFIPVPKTGDKWDPHFQDDPFAFSVDLTGPVTLSGPGSDAFQAQYSTTVRSDVPESDPLHYNQNIAANYVDASVITANNAWGEVKMIRIAAKPDASTIVKDANVTMDWSYQLWANGASTLVGSTIEFGPCGSTKYTVDGQINKGHVPTERVRFTLQTGLISGRVFLDDAFTGELPGTAALAAENGDYTGEVEVSATDVSDAANTKTVTTVDGVYTISGLSAGTYRVTITNPGSTDANDTAKTPLRFSLPKGGAFTASADGTSATATIVVDQANAARNAALHVGIQEPHTVTFAADHAALGFETVKAWHGDTGLVPPSVTADTGYVFTGEWNADGAAYTAAQLAALSVGDDMTLTARVLQTRTLTTADDYTGLMYAHQSFTLSVTSAPNAGPALSYASDNEDVATVNAATGAVQIVGVGDAVITASAPEDENVTACELKIPVHVDKGLVTVSAGTLAAQKEYDGKLTLPAAALSGTLAASGFATGDETMLDQSALTAALTGDANAGTDKAYTVTGYKLTTAGEALYRIADGNKTLTLNNAKVEKKQLTIAPKAASVNKEYTKEAPATEWVVTGLLPGESLYTADSKVTGDHIVHTQTGTAGTLSVTHEAGAYSPPRAEGYAVAPALSDSANYTAQGTAGRVLVVKNTTPLPAAAFSLADGSGTFDGTPHALSLTVDESKAPGYGQANAVSLSNDVKITYTYTRQKLAGENYPASLYQPSATAPVQAGTYTVKAKVQSDVYTLAQSEYTATLTVGKAAPNLILQPCTGRQGQAGTLGALIAGVPDSALAPSGSIVFYQTPQLTGSRPAGAEKLGTALLAPQKGWMVALCALTEPAQGGHTVFAVYPGDINYEAAEMSAYHEPEQAVQPTPAPTDAPGSTPGQTGGQNGQGPTTSQNASEINGAQVRTGDTGAGLWAWVAVLAAAAAAVCGVIVLRQRHR